MMSKESSIGIYQENIKVLQARLKLLARKRNRIAWARFACIILAIACFYYVLPAGTGLAWLSMLGFAAIFIRLVILAVNNNEKIAHLQRLKTINEEEIKIASGDYRKRADGSNLLPALHDYAHDLDILGAASLYQYINRTTSERGNRTLVSWLLAPADASTILLRQEAIRELAGEYHWRQQLEAYGMAENIKVSTEEKLRNWIVPPNRFIDKPYWKWLRFVLPGLITGALLLNIAELLVSPVFYGLVFVFFLISGAISRKIMPDYLRLHKIVAEIDTLRRSIETVEDKKVQSPLLLRLQQTYLTNNSRASGEVKALKGILDRMDVRLNPFLFIPLNIFLFWDLQQIMALEKWKEKNKAHLLQWFQSLAEMEALSSMANVHFNHPKWIFPRIDNEQGNFTATELGHPLIAENKRVNSSFSTTGKPQVALITGSNMAGKSTFLRSVGINIVLAMAGAPVCASACRLSVMRVISSMRIADNLAESTSTFYAELKKLKYIITAVNNQEEVFLLLDEILRGTNSLDRHTGSSALISQLIRHKAAALLATHDLELARLSQEYPSYIHNYHFDVQVENDELYFDYKLKQGVCTSLNASILMKKIGIEL